MMTDNDVEIELNALKDARRALAPFGAGARIRILLWLTAWSDAEAAEEEADMEGAAEAIADAFPRRKH